MFLVLTLGVLSLLITFFLTPIIRDCVGRLGFLDHPDGDRKKHSLPIPRVGGIVIAVSYSATFAIALILPFSYTSVLHGTLPSVWRMILPASVVFLTGLLDDLLGLRPWQKLAGIGAAAMLAVWAGIRVDIPRFEMIGAHPWLGAIITIVWLAGCTNAFNLIDGLDGLAAGVGIFAAGSMLLAALTQGNLPLVLATMPLVGCLLGFLCYNFHPASIFLGDSGSLLIGFLLGCYGAVWSEKSVTLVAMTMPLLAVSVPLLDVVLSILRRFLRNRPIFEADRGHIHHKLLDHGFSPKVAVLIIYGFCALAAATSLIASALHNQFTGLIVILFCAVAWVCIRLLGYSEFARAGTMFLKGGFQRVIDAEARLVDFEKTLVKAADLNECWEGVLAGSRELGFCGVRMNVGGNVFEDWSPSTAGPVWQLRIPLAGSQYINFFRDLSPEASPVLLNAFVGCVERCLRERVGSEETDAVCVPTAPELVYPAGLHGMPHSLSSARGEP